MKNLLTLLCVAVLAFANVTFAQYGGGSSRSGGSSSVLVKDTCPDGDTSGSYFDNSCGDEDMMDDDMMDDDMMDDDTMDVEEEIEDNNEEIIDENEEDMMDDDMDDNIGMSLFDALKDRGGSTTNPGLNTNGEGSEGTDGFVLPGLLAATGAEL